MNILKKIKTYGLFLIFCTLCVCASEKSATATTPIAEQPINNDSSTQSSTLSVVETPSVAVTPETSSQPVTPSSSIDKKPEIASDNQKPITEPKTEIVEKTLEPIVQETQEKTPQEKNVSSDNLLPWKNHLALLNNKGNSWDEKQEKPTQEWQDQALTIALSCLEKNHRTAQDLKTDYLDALQAKYSNIEKSTNMKAFYEAIEKFNQEIDKKASNLTQEKEKSSVDKNKGEPEKGSTEVNNEAEKKPAEEKKETQLETNTDDIQEKESKSKSAEILSTLSKNKKKNKEQNQWKECLENIKNEGKNENEIQAIVDEANTVALSILNKKDTQSKDSTRETLKNDFMTAISDRSPDLYQIAQSHIDSFIQSLEKISPSVNNGMVDIPNAPQTPINQDSLDNALKQEQVPKMESTNTMSSRVKKATIERPLAPSAPSENVVSKPISTNIMHIVQQPSSAIIDMISQKAKQAAMNQIKEKQEQLTHTIQKAAIQKYKLEQEAKQKGMFSSVMSSVLGEWWTGKNVAEKTLENIIKEGSQQIDLIVKNRYTQQDRERIKTAYSTFQEKIVSFDLNLIWDTKTRQPKELFNKWIKETKSALKILVEFNIMSIEKIVYLLKERIQPINMECYVTIKRKLKSTLQEHLNRLQAEQEAMERKQKEEEEKFAQAVKSHQQSTQRQLLEEQRRQEEQKIKEEQERIMQQVKDLKRMNELDEEWSRLLVSIANTNPASDAFNKMSIEQALQNTTETLKNQSVNDSTRKKQIISDRIKDISNALLEQQRKNESHINVHHFIDVFNTEIHKL